MLAIILSVVAFLVIVVPFLIFECNEKPSESDSKPVYKYQKEERKGPELPDSGSSFSENVDEISVNAEYHTMTKTKKPSSIARDSAGDID